MVHLDNKGLQDLRACRANQENRDPLENAGQLDHQAHLEVPEILEDLDWMVRRVQMASRVSRVRLERTADKEAKVTLASEDQQDQKVCLVPVVLPGRRELQVKQEPKEQLAILALLEIEVFRATLVNRVVLDPVDLKAPWVLPERTGSWAHVVCLDRRAQLVQWVLLEPQAGQAWMEDQAFLGPPAKAAH